MTDNNLDRKLAVESLHSSWLRNSFLLTTFSIVLLNVSEKGHFNSNVKYLIYSFPFLGILLGIISIIDYVYLIRNIDKVNYNHVFTRKLSISIIIILIYFLFIIKLLLG